MAKIENADYTKKHGKLNKKDEIIYRVRNGKEHVYKVRNEFDGPASEAQKNHRSNFGKINALVNRIMADPNQLQEWQRRWDDFNRAFEFTPQHPVRPYKTLRQYVFAVIREQIEQTPPPPTQLPKGINLHIRTFMDLSTSELYEILKARYAVFTQEQGIIYLDEDDIDYIATHVFLTRGPKVIAYARLFRGNAESTFLYPERRMETNDAIFYIGRMLTTIRRQGLGTRLMNSLLAEARRQGARTLRLHAQTHAIPFYERFGFQPVGDIFEEANIPHQLMELSL